MYQLYASNKKTHTNNLNKNIKKQQQKNDKKGNNNNH